MPSPDAGPQVDQAPRVGARRKLAAILCADVQGYSRLMGADELGTQGILITYRQAIDPLIGERGGRVVGGAGDSVLADFPSAVEALTCAVDIQRVLHRENAALPADRRLEFRIGINLGDILVDGDEIYGDGVNIAARLQAIAPAAGIVISGGVHDQVKRKLDLTFRDLGAHRVKNIADPVRVYAVGWVGQARQRSRVLRSARYRTLPMAGGLVLLAAGGIVIWLASPGIEKDEPTTTTAPAAGIGSSPAQFEGAGKLPTEPVPAIKPSIAVLPLTNLSGDADEDYFGDGVTEDIISALGRFSHLVVMSWSAVAPYRDRAVSPDELSRDLDIRYVVAGSVRRAGDRVRVAVQLTDAEPGVLLWSERFDEAAEDVFELQDAITRRVVATLAVRVTEFESARIASKPTDSFVAYDYVLRGREHLRRRTREDNFAARELFQSAVDNDPSYARAYLGLAWTHHNDARFGWTEWPHKTLEAARSLAQRAIELDELDARAHSELGSVYQSLGRHDLAEGALERALELNPNDPQVLADRGGLAVWSGKAREAIPWFEAARRFDPHIDPGWADLGMAYYVERRYDDAIRTLEDGLSRHSDRAFGWITLTAAYVAANRFEQARAAAAQVRRKNPFFQIEAFARLPTFPGPADRERIAAHLRKSGLD